MNILVDGIHIHTVHIDRDLIMAKSSYTYVLCRTSLYTYRLLPSNQPILDYNHIGNIQNHTLSFFQLKGTVLSLLQESNDGFCIRQDTRCSTIFVCLKDSTWARYDQAKTISVQSTTTLTPCLPSQRIFQHVNTQCQRSQQQCGHVIFQKNQITFFLLFQLVFYFSRVSAYSLTMLTRYPRSHRPC